MAILHKVESLGTGQYKVIYKVTKKDIDGKDVIVPCNVSTMTNAEVDEEIVRAEAIITNAQNRIQDLNTVKIEIAKLK